MSTLSLDHKIFSYIYSGIRKTTFNNTIDQFYSPAISKHFDKIGWGEMDKEATRLIKNWLTLNELSYYDRYPDEKAEFTSEFWRWGKHEPLTAVQLYKYLQCLEYNIDGQDKAPDVVLLKAWIQDLQVAIINASPEYQAAKWSD